MKKGKWRTTEELLYYMGIVSIIVMCIVVLLAKRYSAILQKFSLPCAFRLMTGYYCPGCGGTRAVKFFLSGHFIKSFIYHPLIPYLGIGGGIFMVSHTIARATRGKIKGVKFRNEYVYLMGIIILIQFLVKNFVLYFFNYPLI